MTTTLQLEILNTAPAGLTLDCAPRETLADGTLCYAAPQATLDDILRAEAQVITNNTTLNSRSILNQEIPRYQFN